MNGRLHASPMKNIAFKAILKIMSFLFQKPCQKSRSRDYLIALEQSLDQCKSVEFEHLAELLHEGKTIQRELKLPKWLSLVTNISK